MKRRVDMCAGMRYDFQHGHCHFRAELYIIEAINFRRYRIYGQIIHFLLKRDGDIVPPLGGL
jgi:hypothetical protein